MDQAGGFPIRRRQAVAEQVERQGADGAVGLPGRGHRLVGQPDLLHGGHEADGGHADPAPLLGHQQAEETEGSHLAQEISGAPPLVPGCRRTAGASRSLRHPRRNAAASAGVAIVSGETGASAAPGAQS